MPIAERPACGLTERQRPGVDIVRFTDSVHFKTEEDAHGHNQFVYDREK